MGFQTKVAQVNDFRQSLTSASLNSMTHGLFKILTHEEEKNQSHVENNSDKEDVKSLEYLENCANATRGTEAYDQYEWLNSDE